MHRSSLVEIQLVLERDGITFMNEIGKEKEMEKLFGLVTQNNHKTTTPSAKGYLRKFHY